MKRENDLGRDDIRRLVWRIALPSMLAQFVSVLYSVVDRMYIGHIADVGSLALAGVGVCGPVVTLVGSAAFWVGVGGTPLMSIRLGEGGYAGGPAHPVELLLAAVRAFGGADGGGAAAAGTDAASVREAARPMPTPTPIFLCTCSARRLHCCRSDLTSSSSVRATPRLACFR